MKAIAVLLAVLMALPLAFASVDVGDRVTVYDDENAPIADHFGYFDVANTNINEVAVCTTKDKDKGYVVASLKSRDLIGRAIQTAKDLFVSMQGAGGFEHFGCARVRV